jgi:hypothetical protein
MGEGGAVKYLMFYAMFVFLLGFYVSIYDFTGIDGLEQLGPLSEPSQNIFDGIGRFFFLLSVGFNPESPLFFLSFIFSAMTVPLVYIFIKMLPFT